MENATNESNSSSNTTLNDIASGVHDNPVQPRHHKFPATKFGNRFRSFNPAWFNTYPWLEYSITKDAAFCYACRFFGMGQLRDDSAFVTCGFRNWKNASGSGGKLEKHGTSERHQHAVSSWKDYTANTRESTSIASTLNTQRQQQVLNKHYIKTVLEVIKYCAFQELALRGHREDQLAKNKGNFLELLHLISEHDPIVKSRLQDGPRNATYTSHVIQDELIHLLAKNVRMKICEEVKTARYFSIIADESRDVARQEQMSFVVRYFNTDNCTVNERFLSFVQAKSLDANSLSQYIVKLIRDCDFDLNKLVSQGYDGASVMSGQHTGVQTRVRESAPYAHYIHCHAHVLNLVL